MLPVSIAAMASAGTGSADVADAGASVFAWQAVAPSAIAMTYRRGRVIGIIDLNEGTTRYATATATQLIGIRFQLIHNVVPMLDFSTTATTNGSKRIRRIKRFLS
jgi:hypothetical protein